MQTTQSSESSGEWSMACRKSGLGPMGTRFLSRTGRMALDMTTPVPPFRGVFKRFKKAGVVSPTAPEPS